MAPYLNYDHASGRSPSAPGTPPGRTAYSRWSPGSDVPPRRCRAACLDARPSGDGTRPAHDTLTWSTPPCAPPRSGRVAATCSPGASCCWCARRWYCGPRGELDHAEEPPHFVADLREQHFRRLVVHRRDRIQTGLPASRVAVSDKLIGNYVAHPPACLGSRLAIVSITQVHMSEVEKTASEVLTCTSPLLLPQVRENDQKPHAPNFSPLPG